MSLMRIHLCRFLPGFFPFSVVYYTYIKGGNCPLLKNIFKEATMAAKTIGIFDIIGPNMIGPSSSHTAGALRIALLAGKMAKGRIVRADFVLYGSFAQTYRGHGTDSALLAGILGFGTEDRRIKDSFRYADEAGLQYSFTTNTVKTGIHPNTVGITVATEDGKTTTVTGESIGGGSVLIKRINGVDIDLSGEYDTILVKQIDRPGVVAYITRCLSIYNINIAFMRMYRENKGEIAYTIVEADEQIPQEVVDLIEEHTSIESALLIRI